MRGLLWAAGLLSSMARLAPAQGAASPSPEGALAQLRAFLQGTRTLSAEFTQHTVKPAGGGDDAKAGAGSSVARVPVKGRFDLARPDRFRWQTLSPYEQIIVADGKQLWTFDRDLNQVTVRDQAAAVAQSPAAVLASPSAAELERNYSLKDLGKRNDDGLAWVEARPKARDNSLFESVALGFRAGLPERIELRDHFGQIARITLVNVKRNAPLDEAALRFTPPAGADVLRQ